MVGAQPAIVGAAPFHRRIKMIRHLRRFEKDLATPPVIIDIVGDQHALGAVQRAVLQHQHYAVLKYDLSLHLAKTCGADRERDVIEEVGADAISHAPPVSLVRAPASPHRARTISAPPRTSIEWRRDRRRPPPASESRRRVSTPDTRSETRDRYRPRDAGRAAFAQASWPVTQEM